MGSIGTLWFGTVVVSNLVGAVQFTLEVDKGVRDREFFLLYQFTMVKMLERAASDMEPLTYAIR